MGDVLAETTDGRYRVILEQDTDVERPMDAGDCWVTSVLTYDAWRHGGTEWREMRDPGGRLDALDRFDHSEILWSLKVDETDAFKRYMRIFHGIEVFDVTVVNGYRDTSNALAWVEPSEAKRVGWTPGDYLEQVVKDELAEHNRWAEGDAWGYVVQELVEWVRIEDRDELGAQTRETWEHVDSCWGFIGHEYAEQEARDALASHGEVE